MEKKASDWALSWVGPTYRFKIPSLWSGLRSVTAPTPACAAMRSAQMGSERGLHLAGANGCSGLTDLDHERAAALAANREIVAGRAHPTIGRDTFTISSQLAIDMDVHPSPPKPRPARHGPFFTKMLDFISWAIRLILSMFFE